MPKKPTNRSAIPIPLPVPAPPLAAASVPMIKRPTTPRQAPGKASAQQSNGTNGAARVIPAPPVATPKAKPLPQTKPLPKEAISKEVATKAAPSKAVKTPAKRSAKAKATLPPPTFEEVSVRAYLISEQRQRDGRWAEPSEDWAEAERQLTAERAQ